MNVGNFTVTISTNVAEVKALVDELVIAASKVDELITKINNTPLELTTKF